MIRYLFHLAFFIWIVAFTSCVSSESPTLRQCRQLQDSLHQRISTLDSSLISAIDSMRAYCTVLSTDTLLATDSLLRERYSGIKEAVSNLEFTQSELHTWRDGLIVLPDAEAIARGAENPFGVAAGDAGVHLKLQSYADTLTTIEQHIQDQLRTNNYERTTTPQPQE